jgi:multidrug efflux pump subunit AcrA (membrane-fusion protein)
VTLRLQAQGAGQGAVTIPVGALRDAGAGYAVWIFDPATKSVAQQNVEVGRLGEENADIISGLKPGDRIVALGAHLLKHGEKVAVAEDTIIGAAR